MENLTANTPTNLDTEWGPATVTLDRRDWELVCGLISAHTESPIFHASDTRALTAIGIEVERQLEARCREAQP